MPVNMHSNFFPFRASSVCLKSICRPFDQRFNALGYILHPFSIDSRMQKRKPEQHPLGIVRCRAKHQKTNGTHWKTSDQLNIGCSTIASDHIQKPHIFRKIACIIGRFHLFISLELRFICVLHCRHRCRPQTGDKNKRRECVVNARIQESVFSNQLACGCELSKTCINISLINRLTNCLHTYAAA